MLARYCKTSKALAGFPIPKMGSQSLTLSFCAKIDLNFPIIESTVPNTKRVGQVQLVGPLWPRCAQTSVWIFVRPAWSFQIRNFTISGGRHDCMSFGGLKAARNAENSASKANFCLMKGELRRALERSASRLAMAVSSTVQFQLL